jgi:hypothetical protein
MIMGAAGLGTKNHYAGEGQQQFSSQSGKQIPNRSGVTPPVIDQNTLKVLEITKICTWVPTGTEINKFHCAGEGQQQFNRLIDPCVPTSFPLLRVVVPGLQVRLRGDVRTVLSVTIASASLLLLSMRNNSCLALAVCISSQSCAIFVVGQLHGWPRESSHGKSVQHNLKGFST